MDNFLSGGVEQLQQAKEALTKATALNEAAIESEKLIKSNDKDIAAQKKFMTDKIEDQIHDRREELSKYHIELINDAKKDLKEAERNRKNAKNKAVNSRINDATTVLRSENEELRGQISDLYKHAKLPFFFNNELFYSLYNAKTVKDFLVFALVVLITIAVIPNIVCALIDTKTIFKALIYIGIVVVFLGLYFLGFVLSRGAARTSAIEKSRSIRKKISANKKQISALSNNIKVDTDESAYGLENFDEQIERINRQIVTLENEQKQALADFDAATAPTIRKEIESENLPVIEQLEADGKALRSDYEQKQQKAQEAITYITTQYVAYLGVKNTTTAKIDEMITIINEGRATTIMQALDIINGEIK